MKLHLPTRLRKAIIASFVAIASFATTLTTGTLLAGVATVTLGTSASADVVGPGDYAEGTLPDSIATANSVIELTATEDTVWDASAIEADKKLTFDINAEGYNVKVLAPASSNNKDVSLNNVVADSLWMASGCWMVDDDTDLQNAGTIYLGGGQLQLKKAVTIANDIELGASTTGGVAAALDYSALRIGQWQHTNQSSILTGALIVNEDSKISFQASGSINVAGALRGDGDITLSRYDGSSAFTLSGDTSAYNGSIRSDNAEITIKFGVESVHLGGLAGSSAIVLDSVSAATLALDVADNADLRYTGSLASGISLVKNGAGAQAFTSAIVGDVSVNAGTLTLQAVEGNVTVNSGASLYLQSMAGLASLTVKNDATVYLPGVSVSTEATSWVQDTVYYTAASGDVNMDVVTLEEGGSLISSGGAIVATDASHYVYVTKECLAQDGSLTIEKGRVMICDPENMTAVADSLSSASKIILNGGTLFSPSATWAGESVNYVVGADIEIKQGNGGGTLLVEGDNTTAQTDRTTYTGALTGNGWLYKTGGGYAVLAGDLSGFGGEIHVDGGTLEMSGNTSTSSMLTGAGTLVVSGELTAAGDRKLCTNTTIVSGGKLKTNATDTLWYGGNKTITIEEGGVFDTGAYRQTTGGVYFVLNGGLISGAGTEHGGGMSALDYHSSSSITVNEDSKVSANIKVQGNQTLTLKVAEDKVLTMSGVTHNGGKLALVPVVEGGTAGTLLVTGANRYSGGTDITTGTVELQKTGTLGTGVATMGANTLLKINNDVNTTHAFAIAADATAQIVKTGLSAVSLSAVTDFAGTIRISEGSLGFTQSATVANMVTDGGALLVDAALATPAVLTLGTAPSTPLTIIVQNVASIGDEGIQLFAGAKPTNVVVERFVQTDDTGSYVASYADGVLTKVLVDTPEAGAVTWFTNGVSNDWGADIADQNWNNGSVVHQWMDGSSVTFAGKGETIRIVSAINTPSATVTGTNYEWVLGSADRKLTVEGGVTVAENASLTLTNLTEANYTGVVTGAGTLTLKNMGMKGLPQLASVVSGTAGQTIGTVVIGAGSALQITGSAQMTTLDNITHLVVEAGGRFDNRLTGQELSGADGRDITIAGAGNTTLPVSDGATEGPAAALTFGYECGQNAALTMNRKVILSDDATIAVASGKSAILKGGVEASGHVLSLIGGGSMRMELPKIELGGLNLADGITLNLYRTGDINTANPMSANEKFLLGNVQVSDGSTLIGEYHAGRIEIGNLSGTGTFNLQFKHSSTVVYSAIVSGAADFSGTISLSHTHNSARNAIFGTADHDALSNAVVRFATNTHANTKVGFVLANDGRESIQIAGISTAPGVATDKALIVSQDGVSIDSDGDMRTLEIVGTGTNSFGGTVLAGVNLLMNGEGTQTFNGNLDAFNGTVEVQKGTLNMANVNGASAITLGGEGATLAVTSGVSGKTLLATATGAVLSADLTMTADSSLTLGDTTAWGTTGGLNLDNHKLTINTTDKATLSVALGSAAGTGELLELFTDIGSLVDADDNAIEVITGTTRVSDLFDATGDLADYLLTMQGGTLSLIAKSELGNLEWNDNAESDGANVWGEDNTNWIDGSGETSFSMGDNVSFTGAGEEVTITGTVKPMNVTVAGDYTWTGDGNLEVAGTLQVEQGAHLTISNTGKKAFASNIQVAEDAQLTITDQAEWSGTVSGDGALQLATGQDVGGLGTFINSGSEKQLGVLKISGDGTTLTLDASDNADLLEKVNALEISQNASLIATASKIVDSAGDTFTVDAAKIDVAAEKKLTIADTVKIADAVTKLGGGELVLTAGATGEAHSTIISEGVLKIDATPATSYGLLRSAGASSIYDLGAVSGGGTLLLSNGSISVDSIADDTVVKVATETAGDIVRLQGISGSALEEISLAEGTQLTGVAGDITVGAAGSTSALSLTLDAANVGISSTIAADKKAMIEQTGTLTINDGTMVTLSVDAIASILTQAAYDESMAYLHLTSGTLNITDEELAKVSFTAGNTSIELLQQFGVRLDGVQQGSVVLTGGANGIKIVAEDEQVAGYKELSAFQSTVVTAGKTLELVLDGAAADGSAATVNNLIGGTDSKLLISNTDADTVARLGLVNKQQNILNPEPAESVGADTEFAGDIDATSGVGDVEVVISGPGTLTVGGNLNAAQLSMNEGGLTIHGSDSTVNTLADDGIAADATSADATLNIQGTLTVEDGGSLSGTTITGDGTLSLKDTLSLSDSASLDGVAINLVKNNFNADGALAINGVADATVASLNGQGTLKGGADTVLTVVGNGGRFSGALAELDATAPTKNLLKIAKGASQTLDRMSGSSAWSVENAGDLTISLTNPAAASGTGTNKVLTLDTLALKSDSTTTLVVNTDAPGSYMDLQELTIEDGAIVQLKSTGINEIDFDGSITLAQTTNGVTLGDDVYVELDDSAAFKKVREAVLATDGKVLTLETTYHSDNQYAQMATTGNALAGATLLWSVNTGSLDSNSSLKIVDEVVHSLYNQGTDAAAAQADEIMAAVAGSSTAILGSALASDVERQLRAIRNRTTSMGVGQCEVNEDMPYFNAWINAEGDHHELDADGTNAGYTRDSWGGTVGFDADLNPYVTVGMALTAMYGDIESEAADKAEGDFDTQYVSLFARYSRNAWTHTFVMTAGRADMTLNRTVNYGSGQYETEGETEGTAFGFMYEVGRVYALTEDGGVCLQPMFNVNLRHSTVDGYTESGCDAALAVGEQSSTAVTFGLGARLQAVIGSNIYNRASIFEARVLAKVDAGDRESEADVRLLQGGNGSSVKSAELGAFGAEIGMGITIPMGSEAGSVFIDGSAELRSGYTNVNGTVGYRINF
ncbi:MAG: autotransporter domain-containing protein [Akkermansia sp.]|nr:autotransporter domain-containing protein [Akkermansia sp.]